MTEEQFRNIVMSYHRIMTGVATAILVNSEDVRDCIQDTLETLWKKRDELEDVVNMEAYCLRSVRNNALSMLKVQKRLENSVPEIEERINPETLLEGKDRLLKVMTKIEKLPEPQKTVIKLSAVTGLPPDDVAEMSGLSPGNVRTVLSRARKQLRNLFKTE